MKINMGLGTSDVKSRFTPTKGKSREYGKDHVIVNDRLYDAKDAVEQAKEREDAVEK